MNKLTLQRSLLAGTAIALASSMAPAAHAAKIYPIYSGGGTLASKVYRDIFNCFGKVVPGEAASGQPYPLVAPPTVCPTPTVANQEVLYSPVGSGAGQRAFLNNDPTNGASGLGTPAASNTVAYTSPDFPTYNYPAIDFVGSDAFLTPAQVTTYNTATVSDAASVSFNGQVAANVAGPAMQFPTLATPITIPFNGSGFAINPANSALIANSSEATSNLLLSTASLCGIFNGDITDWSDASLTNDNGGVPLVSSPTPITVVVRSDGSGTSFIMSQFLTANCAAAGHTFTGGVSTTPTWPAGFVKASGSGGVRNTVNATANSIGYVSPDFSEPYDTSATTNPTANIQNFSTVNLNNGTPFIAPSPATTTIAMAATTPPSFTGSPAPAQDPNNWATAGANPTPTGTNSYPIAGFTWLHSYTCYSTSASAADPLAGSNVKGLFNWYVNQGGGKVRAILGAQGFAPLPTGAGHNWANAVYQLTNTFAATHVSVPGAAGTGCATVTAGVKG